MLVGLLAMSTFSPVGSRSSNCVCACACVRACVRACLRACVWVRERENVRSCVRACVCTEWTCGMWYALRWHISTYQFIPCYASAIHKLTHTRILKPFDDSEPTGLKVDIAGLLIMDIALSSCSCGLHFSITYLTYFTGSVCLAEWIWILTLFYPTEQIDLLSPAHAPVAVLGQYINQNQCFHSYRHRHGWSSKNRNSIWWIRHKTNDSIIACENDSLAFSSQLHQNMNNHSYSNLWAFWTFFTTQLVQSFGLVNRLMIVKRVDEWITANLYTAHKKLPHKTLGCSQRQVHTVRRPTFRFSQVKTTKRHSWSTNSPYTHPPTHLHERTASDVNFGQPQRH